MMLNRNNAGACWSVGIEKSVQLRRQPWWPIILFEASVQDQRIKGLFWAVTRISIHAHRLQSESSLTSLFLEGNKLTRPAISNGFTLISHRGYYIRR